jgi:uncharacterized membrane protein YjgN (DUF898 family)
MVAVESAAEQRHPVEFTAAAGEYFRIWIVNLALTVITLGIYSAWAKVRKKRYFYAHTRIGGEGFEYRGKPLAILKGRIIAVGLLAIYGIAGSVSDLLQLALGLAMAIAFPWLLVRSLAFNAHNSAYRNIRFHFGATYRDALKQLALSAVLVLVTLGFAFPYAQARLAKFSADYHRYGTAQFALPNLTGAFYGIYLRLVGLMLLIGVVFVGAGVVFGVAAGVAGINPRSAVPMGLMLIVGPLGIIAVYLLAFAYPRARIGNAIWNHLAIGRTAAGSPQVRFESHLRVRDLMALYLVNILAIVFTLGLATPWAVVRTLRYRARKTTLVVAGGLEQFVAARAADVDASGEEVGEMFGFDFGI